MDSILEGVIHQLKANGCKLESVDGETAIAELEMDSLHLTMFLLDLEDSFKILVTDQIWAQWLRVSDIAAYTEQYRLKFGLANLKELQEEEE